MAKYLKNSAAAPAMNWAHWGLVICFLLIVLYLGTGVFDHDLWSPTEPAVAGVVTEMFRTGHWAIPHIHDFPYLEKPPLAYWLSLFSCKVVGRLDAGWLRLPAAVAGLAALGITGWTLRRRICPAALLALLLIAGTSIFLYELSHRASTDALVNIFAFAAWGVFLRTFRLPPGHTRKGLGWDALLGLILAGSFYVKNFYVSFVVLPPILLFLLWRRQWGRLFRLLALTGVLTGLLILPWAVALYQRGGPDFLRVVFFDNTFGRFLPKSFQYLQTHGVTPLNDAWFVEKYSSPLLYVNGFLYATLPWPLFYLVAIVALYRRGPPPDDFRLFLRLALIAVPVGLSVPSARVIEYLAPILFILFLIGGEVLNEWLSPGGRSLARWERKALGINLLLVAGGLLALLAGLAFYLGHPGLALISLGAITGVGILLGRRSGWDAPSALRWLVLAGAGMALLTAQLYPALNHIKTYRHFFEQVRPAAAGRTLVTTSLNDLRLPLITWYLEQPVTVIGEHELPAMCAGTQPLGLILPPDVYARHQALLARQDPVVIQAERGKTNAFLFVGIPAAPI